MNDNLKDKTVLCYDYGLFVSTAVELAKSFGEVKYYCPWKAAYASSDKLWIGDGMDGITRVRDFFDHVDSADLIFFPDVSDGDLQVYLRSKGKRVWGTGKGEELEQFRWRTKQLLPKLGLPTSPVKRIVGLDALREELQKSDNLWIKISTFRADMETWHHLNYRLSKPRLDRLEWKQGAKANHMEFIVEDHTDAEEVGIDTWNIDGQWPSQAMLGYEIKGAGLIGRIMPYEDFPDVILTVNKALSPLMKQYQYRGSFSSELRNGVLTDPCCRQPSPPSELYPQMYSNFSESVWHGAAGELIEPEVDWEYGCEIVISSDWSQENPLNVYFPDSIADFVKLRNCYKCDGDYSIVPLNEGPRIGAVIGLGKTPSEAIFQAIAHAKLIEGDQVEADLESVPKGIRTIQAAQENGVHFSDEPFPTDEEIQNAIAEE